jgi:type IV secretion system protein VirB9
MRLVRGLLLLLIAGASPAFAEVQPVVGDGDPRLQFVDFDAGQVVQLRGSPGYQLMVELSPDEQVRSVALGDTGAWQVSVNKGGNRLFLKPARTDVRTNMSVVTSVRTYNFDLYALAAPAPDMPYAVQFHYPAPKATATAYEYVDVSAAARRLSKYRITGDQELRPGSVSDDGKQTYISWPKNAPIPAIYSVDRSGNEELANGVMGIDDVYVVDGAPQALVFRIDQAVARAERANPRNGR